MSSRCCDSGCSTPAVNPGFRKALWVALAINLLMFGVEIVSGLRSGSVSLLADAIDFAGDAANYGITLVVLSMGLVWRSRAAMVKGISMLAFGVFGRETTTVTGVPQKWRLSELASAKVAVISVRS